MSLRRGRGTIVLAGSLALLVAAPLAGASTKPLVAGKYAGTTSETSPISFTISANRKTVTSLTASIGYDGICGQGGGPTFSFTVKSTAIGKNGLFTVTTQGVDNATRTAVKISGTISKNVAHGTIATVKPWFRCQAPHQAANPYSETFTARH